MAKVTNFLSIALLVSVLAVSPVFAAKDDVVVDAPKVDVVVDAPKVDVVVDAPKADAPKVDEPAAGAAAAAPVAEKNFCTTVSNGTNSVLNVVDYANPFAYRVETTQANYATLTRLAKSVTVIALVVTNPAVQGAVNSLVSAITNAVGLAEDDSDEDATEPTRLVIGRKA